MHINRFLHRRESAWRELQRILETAEKKGVHALAGPEVENFILLYRQAAADLNYLQTHLPESRYTLNLNHLLGRCHSLIHVERQYSLPQVKKFFWRSFPALLRRERALILLAMAVFMAAFLAAFAAVTLNSPWGDYVLPVEIRETLQQSVEQLSDHGSPGVAAAEKPFFAGYIMTNNIRVSFLAFAGGIFFGLGTVYVLAVNGLVLGAYAGFFSLHRCSLLFWAHILPHGVMELTAVFISAAAGLVLGRALLVPGDLYRLDSLRRSVRRAVQLLLGTPPLFVVAAIIEGFFTPSALPAGWKLAVAGFSGLLLLLYSLSGRPRPSGRKALRRG